MADEMNEFNEIVGTSTVRASSSGRAKAKPEASEKTPEQKEATMWAVHGVNFFPCDRAVDILVPGQYEVQNSPQSGIFFQLKTTSFDNLLRLPDSASEEILNGIEKFWTKEKHFRKFGFLHKRGVLLWGPPGSGKTSTLQLLSQSIVEAGGVSIYVNNPSVAAQGLAILRRIEPIRCVMVMMEDLDAMIQNHGEHEVLALLDGELQIDKVVFIATTNYPERLDKRIVNRPSRFDIVKLIDMPNADARRMFLEAKNKRLTPKKGRNGPKLADGSLELDTWVKETEGFSIAHLKEMIVSVEVFEVPFEKALERLRSMATPPRSTDAGPKTGNYR